MKRVRILMLLVIAMAVAIIGVVFSRQILKIGQPEPISALRIASFPNADVYIDGQKVGATPYYNEKTKPGEYVVKLLPQKTPGTYLPWEGKVGLYAGSETYLNQNMAQSLAQSSGQTLWLEPIARNDSAQLTIVSDPDSAQVFLDGLETGKAPLSLSGISSGDHDISISKIGYADENVRANLIKGYRLNITVKLGALTLSQSSSASPAATPRPTADLINSSSASALPKPYVTIKANELGFLRVRTDPFPDATESGQVKPGENYPLVKENGSWVQIKWGTNLKNLGWVNSLYVVIYK